MWVLLLGSGCSRRPALRPRGQGGLAGSARSRRGIRGGTMGSPTLDLESAHVPDCVAVSLDVLHDPDDPFARGVEPVTDRVFALLDVVAPCDQLEFRHGVSLRPTRTLASAHLDRAIDTGYGWMVVSRRGPVRPAEGS